MVHLIPHRIVVLSPQRKPSGCVHRYFRPVMVKKQQPDPVLERFAIGILRFLIHDREVREKLATLRPLSLGQAARIPGVTPAALSLLAVHLKRAGAA